MYKRLDWAHRAIPVMLGVLSLLAAMVLFVWDAQPQIFGAHAHDYLGSFSLAMIAIAYLAYQGVHKPPAKELAKAILLAIAFLFWAANQLWPASPFATLYNDIAIALFVLDVFLVMVGWPASAPDQSFAESSTDAETAGD